MYRIRIRYPDGYRAPDGNGWIIGGTRYSKTRADRRVEALRQAGHVVHLDLAEWHR